MAFLHGIETIELSTGPVPVTIVKSGVIGLIGIAPKGTPQSLIQVNSANDAAQFGEPVPGFNIPQALKAIFAQGVASVLVVNVFDLTDSSMFTQVTSESHSIVNGACKLSFYPLDNPVITKSDDSATSYVKGTDYTLDSYGNFKIISAAITDVSLKFTYKKLNPSGITSGVIVGSYNGGTGVRTGLQLFDIAKNTYGYNAKILIAPTYSALTGVSAELLSKATNYRAIALLDAAYGTSVSTAISNRGVGAATNFSTGSKRAFLLYPFLKKYDIATDSNQDFPYSAFMAGIMAATDNAQGYWYSPSNKEIAGIVGCERNISSGANDINSDANQLNAAGITTIFNTFGSGLRTFGNRSAAFPTVTAPDNFISVRRTADVVEESLEDAALQFLDLPITQTLIDAIRETGNAFMRTLIQRGALLVGSRVEWNKANNPDEEIAAGHLTFDLIFMAPTPAERITFQSFLDISLLSTLK
jgi:phage tail sheath protein FI